MRAYGLAFGCLIALSVTASLALAAGPAVSFLTPQKYTVPAGETVTLRAAVGPAKTAQPSPWPADRIEWFMVRSGPDQENQETVRPARAEDNFVSVAIKHPGVTLIGLDQRPTVVEMSGAELRGFVTEYAPTNGLTDKLPAPSAKVRVRCVSSAKTLLRAAADDKKIQLSAVAMSKTGQAVELRPNYDPTAIRVGSDLPLSAYVESSKKPGLKVQATNISTGKTASFVTDAGGSGHFRISDLGEWRVECHCVEPLPNDPTADWAVYSATLSFEVTKGAGK